MIPKELEQFINQHDVYKKLEFDIKENTVINLVHEFLKDDHIQTGFLRDLQCVGTLKTKCSYVLQ